MEQLSGQLDRVFSVEHDLEACRDTLKDISMAYGLLLRTAPLPKSSQCCDALCEQVSEQSSCPLVCIYIHGRVELMWAIQNGAILICQTISDHSEFGKLPFM